MTDLGKRISQAIAERDITQSELAKRTGLSEPAISYIVKGTNTPRLPTLMLIAENLNLSLDYLVYGKEKK